MEGWGLEAVGYLPPCIIQSTSILLGPCCVPGTVPRIDGGKDAVMRKRVTTGDLALALALPLSTCGYYGSL